MIPVSACPITIDLGLVRARRRRRRCARRAARPETVHVPLAHTEGSLTLSMTRGSTAAGTVRTHVLADRITRASCFVCADATAAVTLARWIEAELPAMREWLAASDDPVALAPRAPARGEDARRRPDVPRPLGAGRPATPSGRT